LMCEVAGEGVRSALIVSMLRGLIEKQMGSLGDSGEFLTGLNEGMSHLLNESGLGVRASAFYGVIDLSSGMIQLSMAGEVSPIAVFDDGVRQLVPPEEASGPPLGEKEDAKFGSVKAPLKGLRRMVCFTRGITEACDDQGEEFGMTRLLEAVERGGDLPKVMERVAQAVGDFTVSDEFKKAICLLGWDLIL